MHPLLEPDNAAAQLIGYPLGFTGIIMHVAMPVWSWARFVP